MVSQLNYKIFVISSQEGIKYIEALKHHLDSEYGSRIETTIWSNAFFSGDNVTQVLEDFAYTVASSINGPGFAIAVVTPEDVSIIRGRKYKVARDNVWLEIGLFWGAISAALRNAKRNSREDWGYRRIFLVTPSDDEVRTATDLLGIELVNYDWLPDNIKQESVIRAIMEKPFEKIREKIARIEAEDLSQKETTGDKIVRGDKNIKDDMYIKK